MAEYLDYITNVYDAQDTVNDLALSMYKNGVEDGQESAVEYLVKNGYIKWGFETDYLLEQIKNSKEVEHEHT